MSDLGGGDATVSAARAVLMACAPGAHLLDISHHVGRYDIGQAAYLLASAFPHFPPGTVHVVLVDVFEGDEPRLLLCEKDGSYCIAPDNGLLPLAFGTGGMVMRLCHIPARPISFAQWLQAVAAICIQVLQGNTTIYPETADYKVTNTAQPRVLPEGLECNIREIDRYENVVLDLKQETFEQYFDNGRFCIKVLKLQDITTVSHNYNDVPVGAPLCRFNVAGYLEIAINHGHAASSLGIADATAAELRYRTLKIFSAA